MSFADFESQLLLNIRKKNVSSQLINDNRAHIEKSLESPKVMDGFINKLNELVNDKSFSHYKTVEKVFKNPILSNALEAFRNSTALIKAFETDNKDAVKWLLTMEMNPMVQDEDGKTALMVAAEHGKRKYVQKKY